MTILVFDSGIGGLTVLREARVQMPGQRFVYVADDAAFPYGGWEEGALIERVVSLFEGLIERFDPELAIIACNTASTVIMPSLRAKFGIPFVGTVPAIKPAAERTSTGQVSVLATPGTVQRDYTRSLIGEFAASVNVRLVGSEKLAQIAEKFMTTGEVDEAAVWREIEECFIDRLGARTDIVVLGCTHYPFLIEVFRRLAPWPVDWLNPAEAIARRAKSLLGSTSGDWRVADTEDVALFTGNMPPPQMRRLLAGFGFPTGRQLTDMEEPAAARSKATA